MKNKLSNTFCNRGFTSCYPSEMGLGSCCFVKGFTLVELLVVVLIIAILAAVALPQYNKAVKKSEGREVIVALKALNQAYAVYYLENGKFDLPNVDPTKLSISIPELKYFSFWHSYTTPGTPALEFRHKKHSEIDIILEWNSITNRFEIKNTLGEEVCKYFYGGTIQAGSPAGAAGTCQFENGLLY